jgi:ribosomal protein L37AE/L43A
MQQDPMEEWRRLTALYGEMGDLEIRELVDQINDLTPNAQQILRDELKKRGISGKSFASPARGGQDPDDFAAVHWDPREESIENLIDGAPEGGAAAYTWKTGLCRCESIDEAAQLGEMLRRAGIESWIQRPGARYPTPWIDELGVGDLQINVPADQLDQARAVIAQPIPQDIINQMKEEESTPAYEIPVCPKCKAEDPTLESVEPSNNWLCESCGYTWSDPVPDPTEPRTAT